MMLAQRYPTAYDGIAAGAPALYLTKVLIASQWAQQFMNMMGSYPYGCEIDAISAAAISTCDGLDGMIDGVIANTTACMAAFDPFKLVGTLVPNCTQTSGSIIISNAAAAVTNASWHEPWTVDGNQIWHGLNPGADLTGHSSAAHGQPGCAATNCTDGICTGVTNTLGLEWLQLFLAKDANFNYLNLSHGEFGRLAHAGTEEFRSFIDTDDSDLSTFRSAGGKLVTFHGLVCYSIDQAIYKY
jgi:hypothetical protein